jgi:hypothetical protein
MTTELQTICENIVRNDVLCCVSALMEKLLTDNVNWYDDIENLYPPECEHKDHAVEECEVDTDSPQEILEWWMITDRLADELREMREPILQNEYLTVWGRTTSGQAIAYDSCIEKIAQDLIERTKTL